MDKHTPKNKLPKSSHMPLSVHRTRSLLRREPSVCHGVTTNETEVSARVQRTASWHYYCDGVLDLCGSLLPLHDPSSPCLCIFNPFCQAMWRRSATSPAPWTASSVIGLPGRPAAPPVEEDWRSGPSGSGRKPSTAAGPAPSWTWGTRWAEV